MKLLLGVLGLAAAMALTGCQNDKITASDVHSNMSPELDTRAETKGEIDTRISRTLDTNGRSTWDDVLGFFLLDRPSRLSAYPTP